MALHLTPQEHDADPPRNWWTLKIGRAWALKSSAPGFPTLEVFKTKRKAEAAKTNGRLVQLYSDEGRWFRGEAVRNWKPYQARP